MITKKDSKPFLIKFPIGVVSTDSDEKIYEDNWTVVYGLVSDPSGYLRTKVYGNDLPYDKVIRLNAGSNTRKIDYDTMIMLDDVPTLNYQNGDYAVKYIYPEYNGEIVIGLIKIQDVDKPRIYFFRNDSLFYTQLNFDRNELVAYCNKRQTIPFSVGDTVWYREPETENDTDYALEVYSIQDYGYDNNYKPYKIITFRVIEPEEE